MEQFSLFENSNNPPTPPLEKGDTTRFRGGKGGFEKEGHEELPAAHRPSSDVSRLTDLSFDIEATGKNSLTDTVVGIALCKEKGRAYYVPVRHSSGNNISDALTVIKDTLEDESVSKTGHNLKYDILILRQEGINVKGVLFDTMLASYLLNPNKPGHSLEDVSLEYLSHKKTPFPEVLGKRHSFAEVPVDEAARYAAEDAELAMELKDILFGKLRDEGLERLYFDIEMPLIYILADIEEAGIRIDKQKIEDLSKELDREMETLQTRIYKYAGEEFNINSPRQLAKILFEHLGLKPLKKTKTGYSTSVEVLEGLAKTHELPGEILNYRTLHKLKTTYADTLPLIINRKTGRIHTSFNQTVTATGRLSSSNPNLQNIPIRGEWGARIRECFISDSGCFLVSADYSQIELRILAHLSGDEGLINAFREDMDVHAKTASELFGVPEDAVTEEMRRAAKTVNFGVVYGISPYGLSEALDIPPKDAGAYIERYFEKHGGAREYMDNIVDTAKKQGYVATLMGRKRPIPEINSPNSNIRMQSERLAINTPVQGTAADLIKIAMINLWRKLREKKFKSRMVLQIHDELLLEVPEDELEDIRDLIKHEMENALALSVPLKVDIGWGRDWNALFFLDK